jgi:hypothetical protein
LTGQRLESYLVPQGVDLLVEEIDAFTVQIERGDLGFQSSVPSDQTGSSGQTGKKVLNVGCADRKGSA